VTASWKFPYEGDFRCMSKRTTFILTLKFPSSQSLGGLSMLLIDIPTDVDVQNRDDPILIIDGEEYAVVPSPDSVGSSFAG
jgi:hypothetical protein